MGTNTFITDCHVYNDQYLVRSHLLLFRTDTNLSVLAGDRIVLSDNGDYRQFLSFLLSRYYTDKAIKHLYGRTNYQTGINHFIFSSLRLSYASAKRSICAHNDYQLFYLLRIGIIYLFLIQQKVSKA